MIDPVIDTRRRARRSFAILCLWIPLSIFAAISLAQLALLPVLSSTVAIHWDAAGGPDGFAPAWVYPILSVGVGGGVTLPLACFALVEMKGPRKRTRYRFLGTVIGAETGLLATLMFGLVLVQVGLDDATEANGVGWVIGLGLVVAAVTGTTFFVLLEDPPPAEGDEREDPLPPADSLPAVWSRSVSISRGGAIALGALLGGTSLMVLILCFVALRETGGVPFGMWATLLLVVVVILLVVGTLRFGVRIDDSGIDVRALVGWPRVHIPSERITSARVVDVSPMAEFGGWGWRFGGNGTGIVLRAGEGIRIGREGKSDLTVTVDDAETAVALLRRTMRGA